MPSLLTYDSRVNLPAIVLGALVAFGANIILLTFGTGIALAASYFRFTDEPGSAARLLYFAAQTLIVCAAGGYVGGHYSAQRSLNDSRIHGFGSVALAGIVMAFFLAAPTIVTLRSFANGTLSATLTQPHAPAIAPPGGAGAGLAAQPPQARAYLLRSILEIEGALVGAWAGGMAYSRRARRGSVGYTGEESRAA